MEHVAIMKKSWGLIEKILSEEKTAESHWYKTKQEAREYGGEKLKIPPEQLDFFPSRISEKERWLNG